MTRRSTVLLSPKPQLAPSLPLPDESRSVTNVEVAGSLVEASATALRRAPLHHHPVRVFRGDDDDQFLQIPPQHQPCARGVRPHADPVCADIALDLDPERTALPQAFC